MVRAWNITNSATTPNVNIGIYGMAMSANTNWRKRGVEGSASSNSN